MYPSRILSFAAMVAAIFITGEVRADTFQVIHNFGDAVSSGQPKTHKLAIDAAGAIYGAAGSKVWKITPPSLLHLGWQASLVHDFGGDTPIPQIELDPQDDIYVGTETGKLYEITTGSLRPVLLASSLWINPVSSFTIDPQGRFSGSTFDGGSDYNGSLFRVVNALPRGRFVQTFYNFSPAAPDLSAANPTWLTAGSDGTLYGTTAYGSPPGAAPGRYSGLIYRVLPGQNAPQVLAGVPGSYNMKPLGAVPDGNGNLYGVLLHSSVTGAPDGSGDIYKWSQTSGLRTLHTFKLNDITGWEPTTPPIVGTDGNLYGTMGFGGAGTRWCGLVYRLTPAGQYTVLHAFDCGAGGEFPDTGLVLLCHERG